MAAATARQAGLRAHRRVDAADLLFALETVLGPEIALRASLLLALRDPDFSARTPSRPWIRCVVGALGVAALGTALMPAGAVLGAVSLAFGAIFLCVVAVKLLAVVPQRPGPARRRQHLSLQDLPVYSVLVPLFRETEVADQLVDGLLGLDYPREKLDIKIILEAEDAATIAHFRAMRLPPCFEVIIVPQGSPQTKPRALNYALYFARGELVTIFDAEDIPHPSQLRLAAETFAAGPPRLACLQARLAFYRPGHNWLTRQFAIEYAALFDLLLPALGRNRLPLMLGGTSNHFRAEVLRKIGAWDPFNVTEDADLGLRLARLGFEVDVIDSATDEEPNGRLPSWFRQRARWIKGWMQTAIVHLASPARLYSELGPERFFVVLALFASMVVSSFVHPLFLALTLWSIFRGTVLTGGPAIGTSLLVGLGLAVFTLGYGVSLLAGLMGIRARGLKGFAGSLLTMPAYWLLISAAAFLALWQFFRNRFHWNKTEHGHMTQPFGSGDGR
ncbi:MAG TPA: glycosyltransferase [Aestuariivirgaceae bacterium]|nr:glycosyltransferase [Aestuariivirgaceae bacterium]